MVVVDSSALVPLGSIGRLDLLSAVFEEVRTTQDVREEVLVEGKPGTPVLESFLECVRIRERPPDAADVAQLSGIAVADASVVLVAKADDDVLLANDKALIEAARAHGVDCWWVTTVLLACVESRVLSAEEATDVLYDLVDDGMNLHPRVYARVQEKLRDLEE